MSSTFDVSMVQSDRASNGARIAEAEALAAEAMRMATEAKRAAERLAEVKATLALFSKKLDNVGRYRPVDEKNAIDEATPFEADKAAAIAGAAPVVPASAAQPKPETPIRKKVDAPIREVVAAVEPANKAVVEEGPIDEIVPASETKEVAVVEESYKEEKVALEESYKEEAVALEEPVEDEPVAKEEPSSVEEPIKKVAVAAARAPKKVTINETHLTNDRERVSEAPQAAASTALIPQEAARKEFYEAALDAIGLDKFCGVDDETITAALIADAPSPWKATVKKIPVAKSEKSASVARSPKKLSVQETPATKSRKTVSLAPEAPAPMAVISHEEVEKEFFEAALDSFGLDKACGVDDATVQAAYGIEAPKNVTVPEKIAEASISTKNELSSHESVPTLKKKTAKSPKVVAAQNQIVPAGVDIDKDLVEAVLDSFGLDKMCGIDDVTLGIAQPVLEPEPQPEPAVVTTSVNPTKDILVGPSDSLPAGERVHAEPQKALVTDKQREEHVQQKHLVKAPVNYDAADLFGMEHDALAFCGAIADICEPDFSVLDQPAYVAQIEFSEATSAPKSPIEGSVPEASVLKEETVASKQGDSSSMDIDVEPDQSPLDVVAEDVSSHGADPDGSKPEESHFYEEETAEYYIEDQDKQLLRLVDEHIWCV